MRNVHAMKLYFKNFEIYHNISIYSQLPPIHMILSKLGHTIKVLPKFNKSNHLRYNRFYIIGDSNNKVHTINSVLLFVSYSLISFNFYLFYFPEAAAEPLGSARRALRAPRSTGWEPLVYAIGSRLLYFIRH